MPLLRRTVAGGAIGSSRLLDYAHDHYHVANAAADVHTDLSRLDDLAEDEVFEVAAAVLQGGGRGHPDGFESALVESRGFRQPARAGTFCVALRGGQRGWRGCA